ITTFVLVLSMSINVIVGIVIFTFVFFFFSSRRRHTRFSRDWSSDVCSSDLIDAIALRLRENVWQSANERNGFRKECGEQAISVGLEPVDLSESINDVLR